jgi:hypothetical protein
MKKKILFFLLLFSNHIVIAQKEDATWMGGYYGGTDPDTSTNFFVFSLKFNEDKTREFKKFNHCSTAIKGGNASICDKNGNMIIFFNGQEIYNRNMEPMKGSDSLNFIPKEEPSLQLSYMQNSLILPYPKHDNQYFVIYQRNVGNLTLQVDTIKEEASAALKTFYCIVDMNLENGLGKVIQREKLISADSLSKGRLSAVRHANGRDWWIISQKFSMQISTVTNIYYKFLLTPKGIRLDNKQKIGTDNVAILGQTLFSPDGNTFVDFDGIGFPTQSTYFNFDRCSGQLSNPKYINFPNYQVVGGVAISPNSHYLYINRYDTLYQFDLRANDLWKSKTIVGIFDNFIFWGIQSTGMFNMKLAHDGKIYIACQGGVPYMHIIHNPDMPGSFCKFELRGLKLPSFHLRNVPNYPNFALGTLKGSPCDTLNMIGTEDMTEDNGISISPNPAYNLLNIQFAKSIKARVILRSVSGNILKNIETEQDVQLDIQDIPNGIIFAEIWSNGLRIDTKKVIIIH